MHSIHNTKVNKCRNPFVTYLFSFKQRQERGARRVEGLRCGTCFSSFRTNCLRFLRLFMLFAAKCWLDSGCGLVKLEKKKFSSIEYFKIENHIIWHLKPMKIYRLSSVFNDPLIFEFNLTIQSSLTLWAFGILHSTCVHNCCSITIYLLPPFFFFLICEQLEWKVISVQYRMMWHCLFSYSLDPVIILLGLWIACECMKWILGIRVYNRYAFYIQNQLTLAPRYSTCYAKQNENLSQYIRWNWDRLVVIEHDECFVLLVSRQAPRVSSQNDPSWYYSVVLLSNICIL